MRQPATADHTRGPVIAAARGAHESTPPAEVAPPAETVPAPETETDQRSARDLHATSVVTAGTARIDHAPVAHATAGTPTVNVIVNVTVTVNVNVTGTDIATEIGIGMGAGEETVTVTVTMHIGAAARPVGTHYAMCVECKATSQRNAL